MSCVDAESWSLAARRRFQSSSSAAKDIEAHPQRLPEAQPVTQGINDINDSRRRLRLLLANRAIALGWALRGFCKPCAQRLLNIARRLVPEIQRFLLHRTGSHNPNRRIVELAVAFLLSRIQPLAVVAGLVIVLVLLGSLDLTLRTSATDTESLVEISAFRHEPQIRSGSSVVSVSKSSETMQGFVSETGSISRAQIAPVPLPLKKPESVSQVPNGKAARANQASQQRMAQQKRARPKPMR